MADKIKELYDFVNAAQRNRNYSPNTATSMRTALRLFEKELNKDERESLEKFENRLGQITRALFSKNKTKYKPASLRAYKLRVQRLLKAYNKYGSDPEKMVSWKSVKSEKKEKPKRTKKASISYQDDTSVIRLNEAEVVRNEIELRTGRKVIILAPQGLSLGEIEDIEEFWIFRKKIAEKKVKPGGEKIQFSE